VVNIINQPNNPNLGGFRHYSGLLPVALMSGDPHHASVRIFHIPSGNAAAIFRGDIAVIGGATPGNQGAADFPQNISAPSASVVIGNGGGSGLGNASEAPNIIRWTPGDTTSTSVIAGVVVGFGPITLYMAKNGFQYIPASTEAWAFVETDPEVEMAITVPTVPGTAFNQLLMGAGADVQANAGFQSTRFGISGVSLNPAIATTATLPLRVLHSGMQIGNDPTSAGFVANVTFNKLRHWRGNPGTGTTNVPFAGGD
jgi:hypothetical protein